MNRRVSILIVLILALAGCGRSASPPAAPESTASATEATSSAVAQSPAGSGVQVRISTTGSDLPVALTFFVDPGNRVYVRHITFNNVTKINDEVLRREMRQLEGGVLSKALVTRSEERLQRLPYIKSVKTETKPVPGTPDLVDVEVKVEEGPSSSLHE